MRVGILQRTEIAHLTKKLTKKCILEEKEFGVSFQVAMSKKKKNTAIMICSMKNINKLASGGFE